MNEQQWEEVKIEDVKSGDVARCNGREFPVEAHSHGWRIQIVRPLGFCFFVPGNEEAIKAIGVIFWRKVKREPRTVIREVGLGGSGTCGVIGLPLEWKGARVHITEILDGEEGA